MALRRGSATEAIWALERSAQLTTDSARRGRRLLLAAEHAFGLGRADLVDQLLGKAARTGLSRLDRARMEWLREIFNDGVPGDAGRVLELCGIAAESAAAGELDLALNLLLGAALRCWWADTGPAARARVAEVTGSLDGAAGDPRYVAALAVAEPVLRGRQVPQALEDLMPASGFAQVAIQSGKYAARQVMARLRGRPALGPFRYFDKGMLATISRFRAVAAIGPLRLAGFPAWLLWLVVHLYYLVGFKNRVSVVLHWAVSFVGHGRSERTIAALPTRTTPVPVAQPQQETVG